MTNITINERRRELVITKKFDKAASRFGSDEYLELREARRDFPNFKVVVRSSSKSNMETYKGLTYEYMEKYIEAHDDEEKTIMIQFRKMRNLDGTEPMAFSFKQIRDWFLKNYPEIEEFYTKKVA